MGCFSIDNSDFEWVGLVELIFGSSRVVGKYSTNDAPPSRNYAHNLPSGAPGNENRCNFCPEKKMLVRLYSHFSLD